MNEIKKEEYLLSVKDLEVQYTAGGEVIRAVNGISFDIRKGETLGLVGETGAGKTTVAKSILRILPDPPAKVVGGAVYLEGKNIFKMSEKEVRKIRGKKISMVFQDPMTALNPVYTIGDQIAEVIRVHENIKKKEAYPKAAALLEMVGIPAERYSEYPHQFSGGMKQRVVIAMALACNPEVLLADEPTTALDVTIQAQVLDMIGKLKTEFHTSMIMITHDLGIVAEVCDKVAIVYAGEVVESGTIEDIYDHPSHPYTLGLFSSVPSLTTEETRLRPIPGMPPNPADLPSGCCFHPRCERACEECKENRIPLTELTPGHYVRCLKTGKEV